MTKLLIVDDEPATVDMLSMFLEINGYESAGAYNGTDGLVLLEADPPDMLILDLMMPDLEGFEVCRRVRTMNCCEKTPVLVISARTDEESKKKAIEAGANGYMTKPLSLPQLLGEIQRLTTSASA